MNWTSGLIIAGACGICVMIGLTAGVNLNPSSTVKYIWDWNAAGSWVSGIGALLAVIVTLRLADKSRREDVESLVVKCSMAIIGSQGPRLLIELTSNGKRDAHVSAVYFTTPHATANYWQVRHHAASTPLPAHLGYGKKATLICNEETIKELAKFLAEHSNGNASRLTVHAVTTLKEFSEEVHPMIVGLIEDEIRRS